MKSKDLKFSINAMSNTVVEGITQRTFAMAVESTLAARGYQARAYKPVGSKAWALRTTAIRVVVSHIVDSL